MVDEVFSAAVVAHVGTPKVPDGTTPAERLNAAVGAPVTDLVARVRSLLSDLDAADPPLWNSPDIAEVARRTRTWLRERHPELTEAAVDALTNRFTFEWR